MNSHRYTASATVKALRVIFEENRDKSFEARWALAKASESYRGFQILCRTSAKVLLGAAIPLLLVGLIISRNAVADDHASPIILIAILLYVALSVVVSRRLGIKVATRRMAKSAVDGQRSV
jgi:O-antigen/teichoic acid export membrane protein